MTEEQFQSLERNLISNGVVFMVQMIRNQKLAIDNNCELLHSNK